MLLESIINGEEAWSLLHLALFLPGNISDNYQVIRMKIFSSPVVLQIHRMTCNNRVLGRMADCVICSVRKCEPSLYFILTLSLIFVFSHKFRKHALSVMFQVLF